LGRGRWRHGGAIALAVIGFNWGGWVTHATASKNARDAADRAIVRVLAPICAEKFRQQADASSKMVELRKASTWERGTFVEKGGWATMPGSTTPSTGVARACAEILDKPKV
jgi:alpha/beta superfamily hydrolase